MPRPAKRAVARKLKLIFIYSQQWCCSVITASGADSELRKQLAEGKNLLKTLVQESRGSLFDLSRFEARKRSSVKKATTIISGSIAEQSRALECQVCDCLSNSDGKGRLMCHRCISPSIDIVLQNWQKRPIAVRRPSHGNTWTWNMHDCQCDSTYVILT